MAEFLTQDDADKRYGKKSRTNAGLTLGIIGTALAAFNNGGNDGCFCGGGNNGGGGILGGLFGNRGGGGCCCAMNAARYGWADNPDCNLYGENGLPVAPFRTDCW